MLGEYLKDEGVEAELVLGLPRGGVIVAAEVARALACPLDVLLVRKIGHPFHREFAVGALAEPDVVILDEQSIGWNPMVRLELQDIIAEEKARLADYAARFRRGPPPELTDKVILLVDDGLATGATTAAAVSAARKRGARRVIVAAPVASTSACERLRRVADEVKVLWADPYFQAVGRYYDVFDQTTDAEVLAALREAAQRTNSAG